MGREGSVNERVEGPMEAPNGVRSSFGIERPRKSSVRWVVPSRDTGGGSKVDFKRPAGTKKRRNLRSPPVTLAAPLSRAKNARMIYQFRRGPSRNLPALALSSPAFFTGPHRRRSGDTGCAVARASEAANDAPTTSGGRRHPSVS
ncbi:hypothetical protein KM043_004989 [Ampulex compressa]|nr:hypothetical protein KM043_004989 [Ampulex compressa]